MSTTTIEPADVLDHWIGTRTETPPSAQDVARWFGADPEVDAAIRTRFGPAVEDALGGGLASWASAPEARIALIILLDQFPRNLYRGEARAFAGDARALALTRELDEATLDALHPSLHYFALVPWMHAEDPDAQRRGERAFARAARVVPTPFRGLFETGQSFARRHREVIERFGRFPHRDRVLGRETSEEERAFLERHPEGF